jgi:transglutaminase-like putative cysteine protease
MSFSRLHKLVCYLIAGMGLFALSLGSELEPLTLTLIGLGFVASWFAEAPLVLGARYASIWNASVVGLLALQVYRGLSDAPTLAMAIEFAAYLQLSRLFNRRGAVEYQQIAVLAFLHLIAATVLSTSLTYGVVFVGFVIATPWMLALSHLRREIEGNYPTVVSGDAQAHSALRRVLASRRVVGPQFLLGTALLSVPLFLMTLTIFVLVPRVGQGFLSFNRDGGQKSTGFGNQIELGGFGLIRDDPTVVLRLTPLPESSKPAPNVGFRLRGTSFDHYDGKRWTRSPSIARELRPFGRDYYVTRRMPDEARDKAYRIVLDALDEPVVFLPTGTVAVKVDPLMKGGRPSLRRITRSAGFDVRYLNGDDIGLLYTVYVSTDPAERDVAPVTDEVADSYLQLPKGTERIAELARKVVDGATEPEAMAKAVERFLKQGAFRYSLDQPDVGNRPPLDVFLFEVKRGHCEYFSSAMSVMLRTLGVPARNVTGFVGGRYNPYGGYYALRQGDAHSWVEVYVPGRGWAGYDPTPASRAAIGPRQNVWADLNALIDALRTRWTTSVVGYDLRTQVGALQRLSQWLASHRPSSAERGFNGGSARSTRFETGTVKLVLGAVIGLAALAGLAYWLGKRRKGTGGRVLGADELEALRLYRELEAALTRRGHPRAPSATPNEHVAALRAAGFADSDAVQQVTDGYMAARYGQASLGPEQLARLRAAVRQVRSGEQPTSGS